MRQTTILIIEDSDIARAALVRAFSSDQQYQILEARALATGMRQARNHNPDCVLLDFGLPDSEGISTLRHFLRAFPEATIVAITGDSSLQKQALAEGAFDFIAKPFEPAEVVRRAELAMSKSAIRPCSRSFHSNYESLQATLEEKRRRDSDMAMRESPRLATTCIAAICDSGKAIVVAADRMFTNPGLSVEFETEEQKIETLATKCVALAAGNSVFATEILGAVRRRLGGNPNPPFDQVITFFRDEYANVRSRAILESVIMPAIGADFRRFMPTGMPLPTYLEKQPNVFGQMMMMSQQHNLGTDFLVAGFDDDGAHLSHVTNPGIASQLKKLGHAAIGSGGIHAMTRLSLSSQSRQRGLMETLADVYTAKRVSEVAPGVGDATDLAVINDRGVWPCPKEIMDQLEHVHSMLTMTFKPDLSALRSKYDELRK